MYVPPQNFGTLMPSGHLSCAEQAEPVMNEILEINALI